MRGSSRMLEWKKLSEQGAQALEWSALVMWVSLCLRKQASHWGPNYHPQNKKCTNKEMKQKLSWQCQRETIQQRVYCYFRGYLESCHPSIPAQSFTIFLMVRKATQQGPSTSGWIWTFWALHSASWQFFRLWCCFTNSIIKHWQQHRGPWNSSVSCFQISGLLVIWQLCPFYCKSHSTKNWLSRYLLYLTCFQLLTTSPVIEHWKGFFTVVLICIFPMVSGAEHLYHVPMVASCMLLCMCVKKKRSVQIFCSVFNQAFFFFF